MAGDGKNDEVERCTRPSCKYCSWYYWLPSYFISCSQNIWYIWLSLDNFDKGAFASRWLNIFCFLEVFVFDVFYYLFPQATSTDKQPMNSVTIHHSQNYEKKLRWRHSAQFLLRCFFFSLARTLFCEANMPAIRFELKKKLYFPIMFWGRDALMFKFCQHKV